MYVPEHFRMPPDDLTAFLQTNRTGTLVSVDPATHRPSASFLPWSLVEDDRLTSHIARVNPQSAHPGPGLVILMGDDAYVSSSWMSPGAVPTWDYETVHLTGEIILHSDPAWIIQSWSDLLERFSEPSIDHWEAAWLERMAQAVTGVEFRIEQVQAKSKLSQNRSAVEVETIAQQLDGVCPHLAGRVRQVSLPHIAARDERVRQARPYGDNSG